MKAPCFKSIRNYPLLRFGMAVVAAAALASSQVQAQNGIVLQDGGTNITESSGTVATTAVTVTAGAKVLVVLVEDHSATQNSEPATISWSGVTLTRGAQSDNSAGTTRGDAIYYLYNPPLATASNLTVTVPTAAQVAVTWFTLNGVNTNVAPLVGTANSGGAANLSATVNNVVVGSWAVANSTYATYNAVPTVTATPGPGTIVTAVDPLGGSGSTTYSAGYVAGLGAGSQTIEVNWNGTGFNPATQKANFAFLVFTPILPINISAAIAAPNPITTGQTSLISITTASLVGTVTNVTLNASAIQGSPSLTLSLSASANTYTNTVTALASTYPTVASLPVTVQDNAGNTFVGNVALIVLGPNEIWNGGAAPDNTWANGLNWVGATAPVAGDQVTFDGSTETSVNMESSYTLSGLTFDNTAGTFNVSNPSSVLTMSGNTVVANNSANTETLNVPIAVGGAVTVAANSGNLVLGQPVSGTGPLVFSGPDAITLNGVNPYNGAISITNGATLNIASGGELNSGGTFTGAISNYGTFSYDGGVSQTFTGAISGNGAFNIGNGGTNSGPIVRLGANVSFTGNMLITNTFVSLTAGNNNNPVTTSILGNPATVGRTVTISNALLSFDTSGGNELGGGAFTPQLGFIVDQGGVMQITSGNCVIGPLTLNGGILNIGSSTSTQYEPFELGGSVTVGGNTASFITNVTDGVGAGLNLSIANTAGNTTFTVASTGASGPDLTVAVPLANSGSEAAGASSSGLTKAGPGTMALTDSYNSYTGPTTINGGTLILADPGLLNGTGPGNGATYAGNIINNGTFVASTGPAAGAQIFTGIISGTGTNEVYGAGCALTLAGINTYTGPTYVGSGGTLYLSGAGSIANSPLIVISNGGLFDVTGENSTFNLASAQSLWNNGTVNGSIGTSSGSSIYPGTDGTYGTANFNNGLTLAVGATVNFDLGTTFNGNNDQITVNGALTIGSGDFVHIKAPSTLANLDQNQDYVLITAGSISGSFSTAPAFDVIPANAGHFSVVTDPINKQVRLHYSNQLSPIIASVSVTPPTGALAYQSVLVSITVAPGAGTVNNVSVNLAALGGSSLSLALSSTPNVWTNSLLIPPTAAPGPYNLTATATDSLSLSGAGNVAFSVATSTQTWDGLGANTSLDTNANWVSGLAPGYIGDGLIFAGTTALTPDLDQNYTVQSIAFSNNAGAFVITNTPGDNLAVAPAGTISNLSSSVQTFNLPVQLNGGARLASTTVGGNVVFAQPVSELVLGNGTLTNAGGTNILSATNTYTGPTYITAGALTIAPGGLLGASNYPGAISNAGTFNFNGGVPQTLAGAISGAGAFNINGGGTNNGPILTLAARSTFTGNVLITNSYVSLASNNTANGTVTSSPLGNPSTAGRIVTINNSILSFDATGGNDLGGGTSSPALGFIVNTNSVLQITSGNCVLGPVTLNGGTINIATATTSVTYEPFELGSTVTVGGGRPSLITNTLDGPYAGLNLTINAGSGNTIFNVGVTGGTGPDLVVAAPLCNSGGNVNAFNGITKSGAGTMELTDPNNSFTSSILINAGTFILGDPGVLQAGVFAQPIGNSATFVVTSAYGQTISGVISGTGSLIVSSNAGSVSPGSLTLSANNTYTGGTLVTNGASLYVTGSIASSTNLFVAGKSTLDFSGATSPVLGPSQTLAGLGTVNTPGAPGLGTSSGTIIAPSNDGTNASGTLMINGGGLSLAVGATAKFAVSATFNGVNDAVAIAGGLALNGNALHIKAPSASVNLDQSADYVLITAGSITGSFATAPIWDVAPLNAAYFSVVTSGTTVTLHYNSVLPPTGSAAFSPTNSLRNSTVLLTVNATNGGNPSIASVTVDETQVGGTVVSLTHASGNSWTTSIPIPPTVAPSTIALPVTITDNGGLVDIFGANLTVVSSTETWNGLGANQSWDTNANWLSGVAPGYLGDKLVFAGTTGLTPLLDQNYSLAGLTFSNNAGAFNITNSTGDYLTMLPGSVISNTSAAAENLNLPIQLGGAVTIRSTTTTGNLVFNQPVGEVTVGTGVLTNATGTNILNAANTYTGITVISNNSTLEIGGAGLLGAGTYPTNIVNNGSFLYTGSNSQAITGIISGTGGLTLNAPPTTSLTIGSGNGTIAANNYTYTGPTLVNSGILNMNFGNNGTSGINVSSNLTINNGGQVVALGSSALEGYTQQTPYLPVIINEGGVLTASNATIFAAHLYGVLTLNGGTLANGAVPDPTYGGWYMNNQVTVNGTNFTSTISDPYFCIGQAGGTTFNVASGGTTQTIPGVDLDVSGVINGTFTGSPDTGLIKTGAGSMRLDSQNTYVHATTINAGIINLNAPESAGVSGPLGTSAASNPGSIIFGGGILQYSAQNQYDYSGRFSTNAAQAIKIDTAGQSVTFATALTSSTGSLTKLGAGTLTLNNGANTYAGSTTVSNGTLTLASGTTIANSTNLSIAAGGTLNVTAVSPFTLGATSSVTASGNATPATLAASGTVSFGLRPITINYDGSHPALTIASGGTLSLNGNAFTVNGTALSPNTYTLIQQASGNVSSSGTYTVAGSAIGAHTAGSIVVNGGLVQLVVVSTYPTVGTNLVFTVTGHSVNFSWPASYLGSSLQSNSIAIAVPADWFTIAGSTTNTNVTVPIGTNANVFYRLNTP